MDDFEDDFEPGGAYDEPPHQSSIAAPLIRALFAAAVAFAIYALLFSDDGDSGELAMPEDQVTTAATPLTPGLPTTPALVTEQPLLPPTEGATATETPGTAGQIGAGVSAQVIAGANTRADQFVDAVATLRELGYDVTESGISPNPYPQTTVFATAGEEAQAEALVSADPRFSVVGDNPGNLSTDIQVHVLVGEDWPIGDAPQPAADATDGATEG